LWYNLEKNGYLDLKDCGCSKEAKIDFLTNVPIEKKKKSLSEFSDFILSI